MAPCDDCAWPTCVAADRCAREPFTAAHEARIRELIAEAFRIVASTPEETEALATRVSAALQHLGSDCFSGFLPADRSGFGDE